MTKVQLKIKDSGGSGIPVVMIHGFPLSHKAFEPQFEALQAEGLRPIAYDRRGFGDSEKPREGYNYDTLADDLHALVHDLDLSDCVLLGFSMGGGEVARYVSRHGSERISGLIFAAAVPPYLAKTADNPDGPLEPAKAKEKLAALQADREAYFETFINKFYEVNGKIVVDQNEISKAISQCQESDPQAAVECMQAFSTTDFRDDLTAITLPTLVIHGDSDAVVPFEGSGKRTHESIADSELAIIAGGPHGINVSHSQQFNSHIIDFVRSLEMSKR